MKKLVIVGRYPFQDRKLEGMVQRIANIDTQIADHPRIYLDLYALKNLRDTHSQIGNTQIYTASFLHFWNVLKILQNADKIYVHSIYFYALILIPLIFTNRRIPIILDVHGTVPEEIENTGNRILAYLMKLVEKAAFARISLAICVTKKMEYFYRKKYINTRAEFMYLPIFTTQVCQQANQDEVNAIRSSFNIPEEAIVFIYAGGLQTWQQIDKMIHTTKCLINHENHYFIFLTAETKSLSEKFKNISGVIPKNVIITHAKPENLRNFYALANFGFILRHDHILNKVANPTKMVEYLYFGIYPVVLTTDIGDFLEMGYEYISLNQINRVTTPPKKSEINHRISLKLLEDTKSQNIAKLLSTIIS